MIRRKFSHGYIELFRGKYNLKDVAFLKRIIDEMTIEEKNNLLSKQFNEMWDKLWIRTNIYSVKQIKELKISKQKFTHLKNGYLVDNKNISFKKLIDESTTNWIEAEWGFPKGRRKIREKNITCAKREFNEETGLLSSDYEILNPTNIKVENILGTNNVQYKHIYYIAQIKTDKIIKIDENNFDQISEIGDIGYFNLKQSLDLIRPYNIEKKKVLKEINNDILQYYKQKKTKF